MLSEYDTGQRREPALGFIVAGAAVGLLLGFPAILAAVMSGGAGHGHYVAARALFPASMLLTLLGGSIGVLSVGVALLQFPLYGGLLGWSLVRNTYLPVAVVGALHLVGVIVCFAGTLPSFS